MSNDLPTIIALILRLLQQFAEWLEVAPREPGRLQHTFDIAFPVAIGAAFGLLGVGIGNRHQARLRERDEIAVAWDGPLTEVRLAVAEAGWPFGFNMNHWMIFMHRMETVRPASAAYYSAMSHRLHQFIAPDLQPVKDWIEAERELFLYWMDAIGGLTDPDNAVVSFLLNRGASPDDFDEVAATRHLGSTGVEATTEKVAMAVSIAHNPVEWSRLKAMVEEAEALATSARTWWSGANRALTAASARGGPAPNESLSARARTLTARGLGRLGIEPPNWTLR